jgi:hypothetical protein
VFKRALVLGVVMGVSGIGGVYLIATFLPRPFSVLIPIGMLAIPMLITWPNWFDSPDDGWRRRLFRRLGVVAAAAPVTSLVSVLIVLTTPYIGWTERMHRQTLEAQGRSEADIVAALDQHRATVSHFAIDGILLTVVPGAIASLVTTGAGAIVWRRRSVRPDARAIAPSLRRH